MESTNIYKEIIIWLIITVAVTILGYILLWHGGVYLENSEKVNEFGLIYRFEIVLGSILLWPVTIVGWLSYFATGTKPYISTLIFFLLQFFGYAILYILFKKLKRNKS